MVGGGIGGLACAQGLVRQGFDVQVVERDHDLARTGGYRLHLPVSAVAALRELLEPTTFELLLGLSASVHGFSLAVRDHRGRRLLTAREPSPGLSLEVDRITLRQVLAVGLDDRLVLGRSCRAWRIEGETVLVDLGVGEIEADIVVIADGAGSQLAQKLAGEPTSAACGLTGIAGRAPWKSLSASTTALLNKEPMLAIGPGGTGLFASLHDPVKFSPIRTPQSEVGTIVPTAIWGLIAVDQALPQGLDQLDPNTLIDVAARLLRRHRWADHLLALVTLSSSESVSAFRFNAADPDNVAPWRSSRVTALGDAVHAMPPTGGQGAATAILDAHALVQQLLKALREEATPVVAIHDYEAQLRTRGAAAVRESMQPVRWIQSTAGPAGSLLLRATTPILAAGSVAARTITGRKAR